MPDIASVTRIDITARDTSGPAFASATNNLEKLGNSTKSLVSHFQELGGALGVALSVAGITEYTKGVIEAAASLDKLAKITGSSVENLSQLSNAAFISGVGFDTFNTLVVKMTGNMQSLDESSTSAQKALKFLGVTARDPAEALRETARALDQFADGAGKAAATKDIFSRSGPEIIEALHAIATASSDLTTVTTRQAEEAHRLGEQIRELAVHSTTFKNAILSDIVPALNEMISGFQVARAAGASWRQAMDLGTIAGNEAGRMKDLQDRLAGINAELDRGRASGFAEFGFGMAALGKKAAATAEEIRILQAVMDAQDAAGKRRGGQALGIDDVGRTQLDYSSVVAKVNPAIAALESFNKSLEEQRLQLTLTADELQYYKAAQLGGGQATSDAVKRNIELKAAQKELADATKELIELGAAAEDRKNREAQATIDHEQALKAETQALQDSVDTFGLSSTASQIYLTNKALEQAKTKGLTVDVEALTKQLDLLNTRLGLEGAAESMREFEQAVKQTAQSIDQDFSNIAANFLFNGKKAFGDLADYAKHLFEKLVLQPALQPLATGLASAFVGGGGTGGGGSSLGGLGSLAGLFGGFGSNAGAGFSVGLTQLGIALTEGTSAIGGLASALGAFTAVAGPIGLALGAAYAAWQAFGTQPGGPKGGGSAFAGPNATFPGADTAGGTRYFTPSDQDSHLQAIVDASLQTYLAVLKSIGGTGTASFGLGFDSDPNGTASDRIAAGAIVNGRQVFQSGAETGRDSAVTQAALQLEAQRAILAALQSSHLPADIANLLNSVTASSATQEQITKVLALAQAYTALDKVMSGGALQDALTAVTKASGGAYLAIKDQGDALAELARNFDGSASAAANLATATGEYYNSLVTELAQIQQMKASLEDSIGGAKRGLTLSTLDNEGQYNFLSREAEGLRGQLGSATNPDQVAQLTNQIVQDLQQAFGLLDETGKNANLGGFLEILDEINQEAQQRLTDLSDSLVAGSSDVLTQVRGAMDSAASTMQGAANTMADAAATFAAAAARPLEVIIPGLQTAGQTNFG